MKQVGIVPYNYYDLYAKFKPLTKQKGIKNIYISDKQDKIKIMF